MKLTELIKNINPTTVIGQDDVEITGVNIDSRCIAEGYLFVAMKGTQVDGHRFIPKAVEQGAKAVLCEDLPEDRKDGVTYVQVASCEDAVGPVATMFYGNPSRKLRLVGVTGTNGKTTIATLLYNMFRKMGHKCGLLSTVVLHNPLGIVMYPTGIAVDLASTIAHGSERLHIIIPSIGLMTGTKCQGCHRLDKRGTIQLTGIDHESFLILDLESMSNIRQSEEFLGKEERIDAGPLLARFIEQTTDLYAISLLITDIACPAVPQA